MGSIWRGAFGSGPNFFYLAKSLYHLLVWKLEENDLIQSLILSNDVIKDYENRWQMLWIGFRKLILGKCVWGELKD